MGQGFEDYVDNILDVPMLYIVRDSKMVEISGKITFREFMRKGFRGFWGTLNDYILHSSLTFPDVRLKKCIEIRNHDAQNNFNALTICAVYKGALYSKRGMEEVMDLLKPLNHKDLETFGLLSAKNGLDYYVDKLKMGAYDVARKIFEISRKNLPEIEKDYLDRALFLLSRRKCMADILFDNNVSDTVSLLKFLNNC